MILCIGSDQYDSPLFSDRTEIVSPGGLPAGMREENLGKRSVPRNPLLFGAMYRMNLVEHIGSGIKRIKDLCREYKVKEPLLECNQNWVTVTFLRPGTSAEAGLGSEKETEQVRRLIATLSDQPVDMKTLMNRLNLAHRQTFLYDYIKPALDAGYIEMTIPDKPRSSKQQYRLTEKGKQILQRQE